MTEKACIYTVANKASQIECANLIHSIRASGCTLDIVLIHFGGEPIDDLFILSQVVQLPLDFFAPEAISFLDELGEVLHCPAGYLRRFLAFFGPYNKFIYTDNDIVALSDWQILVDHLHTYDLVHADQEYTTQSRFNFKNKQSLVLDFGPNAHQAAITAGHFAAKQSSHMIESLRQGLKWMNDKSSDCFLHDQTLLQLASLHGEWKCLNLCKPPYNWLSSWARDYKNTLDLILKIQKGYSITHLHYSGGPIGLLEHPIDELLLSYISPRQRLRHQVISGIKSLSGYNSLMTLIKKVKRRLGFS